jgi:formate dehydrogenase beta subunit
MLLPQLRAIQERVGYLPDEELKRLADRLDVHLHRIHEVVSFFPHFRRKPPPDVEVRVCRDIACHLRGAPACLAGLKMVAEDFGDDTRVNVESVSCLGRCDGAPAVLVELHKAGQPEQVRILQQPFDGDLRARLRTIITAHFEGREVPPDAVDRTPRPWRIDPYQRTTDGDGAQARLYSGARSIAEKLKVAAGDPDRSAVRKSVLAEIEQATLRGMGGAGTPAVQKWRDVMEARGDEKYVVCNADESEPATFKDRELLLRTPDLIIEGMIIAALLFRAKFGYIYIRHEYHDQIHAVDEALKVARARGALGGNVFGTGISFDMEVFMSPGGYVCGEQGALIEAIEERRSEPRNRPPQLETNGLYDKPTLLSNVETFAWAPAIIANGGKWYADSGRKGGPWYTARKKPGAPGLRFFSVCGDVKSPGVFEVEIGSTLGELLDLAGGVRDGLPLKAVAPSGPSGGFIPAVLTKEDVGARAARNFPDGRETLDIRELPLDIDEFRSLNLMLGAGLTVYALEPGVNMLDHALNASRFFRNESCGKCVPCRIGSQKLVLIGEGIAKQGGSARDLSREKALVNELLEILELTSICGLGMSAAKPLSTVLQSFWKDLGLAEPIA